MKRKVGRPKLADDVVRDRLLSVRLTADERAALNATAKAIGVSPSEFARVELLAAAKASAEQPAAELHVNGSQEAAEALASVLPVAYKALVK